MKNLNKKLISKLNCVVDQIRSERGLAKLDHVEYVMRELSGKGRAFKLRLDAEEQPLGSEHTPQSLH